MAGMGRVIGWAGMVLAMGMAMVWPAPSALAEAARPASRPEPVPIEVYGRDARIDHIALSPSGRRIARIEAEGGVRALMVSELAERKSLLGVQIGEVKVWGLSFIDEDRLLVHTSSTESLADLGGGRHEMSFGQIIDLTTGKAAQVLQRTDEVMASPYGPISIVHRDSGPLVLARGFNVMTGDANLHRIDLASGRGRSVRRMSNHISAFVTDAAGEVVAMSEYFEASGRWTLKLVQGGRVRDNWSVDAPLDRPGLIGLGRTQGTVLVSARRPDLIPEKDGSEDGFNYFEVEVETGVWRPLPFDDYPRRLFFHPMTGQLMGHAQLEDMGYRYIFYDELAARRWAAIERAFPNQYPSPETWSHDLGRIIVFLDRDDSGHFQLVDFETRRADLVGEMFPGLTPSRVGKVQHLTYQAADGLEINAYMTLPPGVSAPRGLPLVVLPHGGPAAYDLAGFDYWAQAVASRGYVVLQPNFRGSTGYGRAFMEAGYGEWGRKMQTDLSDGVRHLAGQGVIDPARVCIMGGSYGGYAAMAGLALDGEVYRCAVAFAGISDLRRFVGWRANRLGTANREATRYWTRFMGADGVRDRDLDAYSPVHQVGQVKAPLLLIHGKDDTVVPIEQSRIMANALRAAGKPFEFVELEGEDHWLSQSRTRTRMLSEAVRFLERHNPPD